MEVSDGFFLLLPFSWRCRHRFPLSFSFNPPTSSPQKKTFLPFSPSFSVRTSPSSSFREFEKRRRRPEHDGGSGAKRESTWNVAPPRFLSRQGIYKALLTVCLPRADLAAPARQEDRVRTGGLRALGLDAAAAHPAYDATLLVDLPIEKGERKTN